MPIYVYKILETNETFEIEQRMSEPALQTHPETGQAVRRIIQPVGIAFKGTGFYVNDSKPSSQSKPDSKKSGDDSKGGDGKSTDSKGDANKTTNDSGKKADAASSSKPSPKTKAA